MYSAERVTRSVTLLQRLGRPTVIGLTHEPNGGSSIATARMCRPFTIQLGSSSNAVAGSSAWALPIIIV